MRHLLTITAFLGVLTCIQAGKTVVTSASAINRGNWSAGDTVLLKNGVWTDQVISVRTFGASDRPVVFMAETPGKVVFNGSSRISFSGQYVEFSGIWFNGGILKSAPVVEFRTASSELAEYCRLTDCAIVDYNPSDHAADTKWVSLYGKENRVDHCSFENKTNSGTLMVVWLNANIVPAHIIEYNYFGSRNPNLDENGKELNGQEIIRIGDSNTSMQYANVVVRNNYFRDCNGEIEIISNKSCGNIYSNNVFASCKGMLTLRHGNDCTVEGNYFLGNGVAESGGVRIIGEKHRVYNNYFQDLKGTNFRAGLCVVRGKENSDLDEYFQVKEALVVFNTFVNCAQAFCVNYNSGSDCKMPPVGTVIANNHVYNTNPDNTNVYLAKDDDALDITWVNNLMNRGRYSGFGYAPSEIRTGLEPSMSLMETPAPVYEPAPGSALADFPASGYDFVTGDIRGRWRNPEAKIPGASELTGGPDRMMPSVGTVGVRFMDDVTSLGMISEDIDPPCRFEVKAGSLLVKSWNKNASVEIFDLSGKLAGRFVGGDDGMSALFTGKGFFLIRFRDQNISYTDKVFL